MMYKNEKLFRMPAEWEEHEACWMGWPVQSKAWGEKHLDAKYAIAKLANIISSFEKVNMIVHPDCLKEAKKLLSCGVNIIEMLNDDAWLRDTGPTFVYDADGQLYGVDWLFNAWGTPNYFKHDLDKDVARNICRFLGVPRLDAPIINEGGAVHTDGEGTIICVEKTVLNSNRSGLDKSEAEAIFKEYLGVEKTIWLSDGYDEDETDGHVDVIACFCAPGKIMHLSCRNPKDRNYKSFRNNIETLKHMKDAKGRAIEVIEIEQPRYKAVKKGRLSLSYMNFYIANGAVIVPVFGEYNDELAITKIQELFPEREVIPFPEAETIAYGGGLLHCVTQQQPKILKLKQNEIK